MMTTNTMNSAAAAADYRKALVVLWCQWNGMKGTEKQCAKVYSTTETFERMLTERRVLLPVKGGR